MLKFNIHKADAIRITGQVKTDSIASRLLNQIKTNKKEKHHPKEAKNALASLRSIDFSIVNEEEVH